MQLLKTKFHIPRFNSRSTVPRERLSRLVGNAGPLVLISAPAGFGKTTLLSEWAAATDKPVAWVSLETNEDVPEVFWRYFFTAVASASDGCGEYALEQIRSAGTSSIETILTGVINDVVEKGAEFTLVLDDYHLISDASIHRGMVFFIDHQPESMRLIVAGREKPQLLLSKFRVSGKLTEIRAAQFRFNARETELFLNGTHGLDLTKDALCALADKTEGWIAGLALAAISMRDQRDRLAFVRDFAGSHRYIIDYLMEEVLSGIDPKVREFMLKLSILERFCPELCASVTEHPDSLRILADLQQNNLFLVPLDDRREWFRYHHLFREFLLKTLEKENSGGIHGLHWKAFLWLRGNGYQTEAFDYAVLTGKYGDAAELLAEYAPALHSESGGLLLKQLIARLPQEIVTGNPCLCSYHVLLEAFGGSFDRVDLLQRGCFRDNETVAGFHSLIKGYRYFYQSGEFDKCLAELNTCLRIMPEIHASPLRLAELLLSLCLRYTGDIGAAYDQVRKISRDDDVHVLKAITCLDVLVGMGRFQEALAFIDRTIENGRRHYGEGLLPEYGYIYVVRAGIHRERDEIAEALKTCRKGLYLGRDNAYVEFYFLGNLEYARILAADGNHEEADNAMAASLDAARSSATWGEAMCLAYQARMALSQGKTAFAWLRLKGLVAPSPSAIPYRKHNEYLTFCRYFLHTKAPEKVHELTELMISAGVPIRSERLLVECYVLKAQAFLLQNDRERALQTIEKALMLSEREGYVRVFIDEGDPIRELFRMALEKGTLPDYLKKYAAEPIRGEGVTRSVLINEFRENFNEREIEILKLMKQGGSNKMIAETLFLSVNTVRWYASRIFGKLNVKRRGEAVARAEKYELI